MKKLLAIISILLIIFIGMYINKSNLKQQDNLTVNVSDVEKVEEYISKIYMWQEITEEALPKFDNINNAPDLWIWEVVKKNLENYELTYNEIQEEAIKLFGNNFKKQFPKEGSEYIIYDKNSGKYYTTGIGLDTLEDCFYIKNIIKTKKGYDVEIVEYLEDYIDAMNLQEDETYNIYLKNLNHEIVSTISNTENETKIIEIVKENIDKFTTKKIKLLRDSSENLYIESVE